MNDIDQPTTDAPLADELITPEDEEMSVNLMTALCRVFAAQGFNTSGIELDCAKGAFARHRLAALRAPAQVEGEAISIVSIPWAIAGASSFRFGCTISHGTGGEMQDHIDGALKYAKEQVPDAILGNPEVTTRPTAAPARVEGAKVPTHLYFEDPDDDGVEVQPLSFTRMSELLDYATCYGEFDENTPNGARSKYPNMTTPMNDIRRAVIQTLKRCMGVLPDRVQTAPAVVPIPSREDDHLSVAFAEIAIEQLGYTEDGPNGDTYGLNEDALCRGGALMVQYVRKNFVDNARHDQRVTELLQAVNRENGNRRALASSLRELYRTVIEIHGCFPLDNRRHNAAMSRAVDLLNGGIAR